MNEFPPNPLFSSQVYNTPSLKMSLLDKVLVIDYGSYEMKYGVSQRGLNEKVYTIDRTRSVVGTARDGTSYIGRRVVNEERKGTALDVTHAAPKGYSERHDLSEKLWAYAYEQKGLHSAEQPVVLTVPPGTPRDQLENVTQIFFEGFNVPALAVMHTSTCALFGAGRVSGIVLDIGERMTHAAPLVNGILQKYAVQNEPLGGADVTGYFKGVLSRVYGGSDSMDFLAVGVKEAMCRCSLSHSDALSGVVFPAGLSDRAGLEKEMQLALPDGEELTVKLSQERTLGGEVLFRPGFAPHGKGDVLPVHSVLWNAVQSLPISIAREVVDSTIVCGGTTYCEGFADRLTSEVECIAPTQLKPKLIFPRERTELPWRGAAVSSSLDQFESVWMGKEEYCEEGPSIVHKSL